MAMADEPRMQSPRPGPITSASPDLPNQVQPQKQVQKKDSGSNTSAITVTPRVEAHQNLHTNAAGFLHSEPDLVS